MVIQHNSSDADATVDILVLRRITAILRQTIFAMKATGATRVARILCGECSLLINK